MKEYMKKALGLNPKTNEEARAEFNKQKRRDANKWRKQGQDRINSVSAHLEGIDSDIRKLTKFRHEMELADGRDFDKESKKVSLRQIESEISTGFINMADLKKAVKFRVGEANSQKLLVEN